MDITIAIYQLYNDTTIIKKNRFEIVKETDKCFFTKQGCRYLKSEIGKPILKSATQYPYIELVMIDADEETLRKGLSKWFIDKASRV